MPSPVRSARARLAARLVAGVPSAMSSRSSAAPSGLRRRTAPFTSTVSMNDSMSAGSRWPSTYGNAMQVAVSSSARSGSPEATPSHSLDSTSRTIASASAWLMSPSWPAAAWPAAAWLAGARRRALFLLTASSYGGRADDAHLRLAADDGHGGQFGRDGDAEQAQRRHRDRRPAPVRPVVDLDRAGPAVAQRERVDALGAALDQQAGHRVHQLALLPDRKSTRLNSSHVEIS